ncbi:MAG: 50S ribosomal protein L22 [Gemmatimonadetes bacterium]|nr:50S ribosomal protein L22 [Gemmatimonadota bacterium]
MEARAIQRTVRQSPRKMRLVADLIRGRPVNEAFSILKFSKKGAAKQVSKVLLSAVANARERSLKGDERLDEDALYVKSATVDAGPTLKRFMPAAMGRATPLKKRTSHVKITVATKE